MLMWFTQIAIVQNPDKEQLRQFVDAVLRFLQFVLSEEEFSFLWEVDPELRPLAQETFDRDVAESAVELQNAIEVATRAALMTHGLLGRPARFKYRVLTAVADQWERVRGQFSVREWFKRVVEAINAILKSLSEATGGAGGIIIEFKDALSALASTTE